MPFYRIYRLKDAPRQQFRWAPHTSGIAVAKPKDYDPAGEVEAPSEYAAWRQLRTGGRPLEVGDILETGENRLRICKYVGFEEARWWAPEAPAAETPLGPSAPQGRPEVT